jgi:hypothetical protein
MLRRNAVGKSALPTNLPSLKLHFIECSEPFHKTNAMFDPRKAKTDK